MIPGVNQTTSIGRSGTSRSRPGRASAPRPPPTGRRRPRCRSGARAASRRPSSYTAQVARDRRLPGSGSAGGQRRHAPPGRPRRPARVHAPSAIAISQPARSVSPSASVSSSWNHGAGPTTANDARAHEPRRLGVGEERERLPAHRLVLRAQERDPRAARAHHGLLGPRRRSGVEHLAAGERARAAPQQPAVAGVRRARWWSGSRARGRARCGSPARSPTTAPRWRRRARGRRASRRSSIQCSPACVCHCSRSSISARSPSASSASKPTWSIEPLLSICS